MIEDYLPKDKIPIYMDIFWFGDIFQNLPTDLKPAVDFLVEHMSFSYDSNLYQPYPFIFASKEKAINLSDKDLENALAVLDFTNSHALRAKIFDVVGYCKKDNVLIVRAADEYYLNFKEHIGGGHSYKYIPPLKRALYLWLKNSQKKKMEQYLDGLLENDSFSKDTSLILAHFFSEFVPLYAMNRMKKTLVFVQQAIIDNLEEPISLDIIDALLPYIGPEEKQEWIALYVDIAKKVAVRTSPHGYCYLERAAVHIEKETNLFSELKFLSEEEQKKLFNSLSMQPISVKMDENMLTTFDRFRQESYDALKGLSDGLSQFCWLLSRFKPMSIDEVRKSHDENRDPIFELARKISFNSDGMIDFDSSIATESDKKEHRIASIYDIHTNVVCQLVLYPFISELKIDSSLENLISEILNQNLFVPKERATIIFEKIMGGFRKNIGDALFYLIPQIEYGFFCYIKNIKKIYPMKNGQKINLNNMLVKKGDTANIFREALENIIDSSLLQIIEYRLCRKFGGNFRNRDYHTGVSSTTQFTSQEAETFYLLILVYCYGYDPDL